ncbi:hypothetical protein [Streptomyces sp. CBMA156]|uniref:hypothetical protein n=1 Tax=Streptomyces sp. CBMA156 TaxID=1930280 RepID=UPI0016618CB7|nr:hypothetical protein [Streptomyces sp. CBMA156]MBD0672436.1 hypothetical protein [Streptomyces sp. CBMA156]
MGQKIIRFSDLTGEHVESDRDLVRVVVLQHPDLTEGPVEIDALAGELGEVRELALDLVTIELHHPDRERPQTVVMEAGAFDRLASAAPMAEVLRGARPAERAAMPGTVGPGGRERVDYASLEHAGRPHKGRTTEAEKQVVQRHLDEINERLASEGVRTIDLENVEHVTRYGLDALARETGVMLP